MLCSKIFGIRWILSEGLSDRWVEKLTKARDERKQKIRKIKPDGGIKMEGERGNGVRRNNSN